MRQHCNMVTLIFFCLGEVVTPLCLSSCTFYFPDSSLNKTKPLAHSYLRSLPFYPITHHNTWKTKAFSPSHQLHRDVGSWRLERGNKHSPVTTIPTAQDKPSFNQTRGWERAESSASPPCQHLPRGTRCPSCFEPQPTDISRKPRKRLFQ